MKESFMSNRNTLILIIVITLLALAASVFTAPYMPGKLAVHWNIEGRADRFGSPFEAFYLLPIMILGLGLMLYFIPVIDPLKANIALFRTKYNLIIMALCVFLLFLHISGLVYNLGFPLNMDFIMGPAMGLLMIVIGLVMRSAKRNWFIGIRTPWTLSSDVVWDKTHKVGSWLFVACGVVIMFGMFLPSMMFFAVLMISILATSLGTVIYSYIVFQQENRH
jgi:uncharacterized membrane protein